MSGRITDVPGIRVGHATDRDAVTGCTVILGPFRAACDVRGTATGTRELEAISPLHLVDRADAILLTGGSAFGLAAADGVASWLEEHGHGFDAGVARVPIVPAAVIFDLAVGRPDRRPDPAMGRAACEAAGSDVTEGRVGAGTGATVGKVLGPERAMAGGVGTAAVRGAGFTVGALAVVNALGDVLDGDGRIVAGARDGHGGFADSARLLRSGGLGWPAFPGTNTTLCVVATDAPLDRTALQGLARAGSAGQARRIAPAHTPFDGDLTFAVSTAERADRLPPEPLLALGAMAAEAVAESIQRAVRTPS
ncbi:MAG TPA: P1 family peptidase [Longimicrobiales bacterium]|nr:P1 family peptidase [Longimicrobiales bacterium]